MSEKHDYCIFIIMLYVSVCIGIYHACFGGKQKTTSEYLMGNRRMGTFPIAMSLLASFVSSVRMLGVPSEVYTYGIQFYFRVVGFCLLVPVIVYVFIPVFYNLQVVSVHQYIEMRFSRNLRHFVSILYIICMVFYTAIVIYGPAISLRQATGLNLWWSIAVVGTVAIFYTAIGGIKGVMWTDVVQVIVMVAVLAVICIHGTIDVGGFSKIVEINLMGKRLEPLSFSLDPRIRYTAWGSTIAPFFTWSVWWNIPGQVLLYTLCCYIGCILYAKYWQCDPLASKRIDAPDQILPLFVMEISSAYPGLAGFFVAGVYSDSLSSISSFLNSLSAIILEDFVRTTNRWKSLSEAKAAKISKLIVVIFGVICLALASLGDYVGSIVQSSAFNVNTFIGTIMGIFILGMFFPWATTMGGIIGTILGTAIGLWFSIGIQLTRYVHPRPPISIAGCSSVNTTTNYTGPVTDESVFDLYKISFVWMPSFCAIVVVIIGLLVSFVTGLNNATSIDSRLLSPITRFLLNKIYGEKYRDGDKSEEPSALKVFISDDNDNKRTTRI